MIGVIDSLIASGHSTLPVRMGASEPGSSSTTRLQGLSMLALTMVAIVVYGRWNGRRQGLD
jgi:hypothetical protein